MGLHARDAVVPIGDTEMEYISFGTGKRILVMLPGLGDGLRTMRGMALPFSLAYRAYAREYTVYAFSRKNRLAEGCSIRDMARDQEEAMARLGISGAAVMGVSQGGMIAQHLAADCPALVGRLVLVSTMVKGNQTLTSAVGHWMELARAGDYRGILTDTAEQSYSDKYLKRYRPLYSLLGRLGGPKDFSRFLIQARACLGHDGEPALGRISCPTLVVGGDEDRITGPEASPELAQRIGGSKLLLYRGLGHGLYEEAKDFHAQVLDFLGQGFNC